jgi:hypothetical protein
MLTQYKNMTAALVVGMALPSGFVAADKKITRAQLPAAVERTVSQQSQGAVIKGFSIEKEAGKTVYEMALTVNGHGKDISMDAQGNVLDRGGGGARVVADRRTSWAHQGRGHRDDRQN